MRPPRPALLAALAVLAAPLAAQTVPERGADDTFDVAAWNIEHFGDPGFAPPDAIQARNVEAVIAQAGIDLWAVQEIGSAQAWTDLLAALADDGYTGRLGPQTPGSFQLRLGFIFDPTVVQVIGTRTILSGGDFGGRAPFEMQARVTVQGESRTIRIIGIHAKAGTSSSDYADRRAGAVALKDYIDARIASGESVLLLGDYNDFLTRSTRSGQPSPYAAFLSDDAYVAATLGIEQAGIPTLCGNSACTSGSTRDHLVFTADLDGGYVDGSGDRFSEVITGVPSYVNSTSDHAPVLARFSLLPTAGEDGPERGVALLAPAPSPFRSATRLRFRLAAGSEVALDVFDVTGRRVASVAGVFGVGEHAVALDGAALAPGAYLVRLRAGGEVRTRVVTRL